MRSRSHSTHLQRSHRLHLIISRSHQTATTPSQVRRDQVHSLPERQQTSLSPVLQRTTYSTSTSTHITSTGRKLSKTLHAKRVAKRQLFLLFIKHGAERTYADAERRVRSEASCFWNYEDLAKFLSVNILANTSQSGKDAIIMIAFQSHAPPCSKSPEERKWIPL